jgi:nicotinamide-nucleotide amidase
VKVEVVAVGTELLLGQIVDTNSAWIGEQLALAGLDSHYQTKVGDNWARMAEVIGTAIDRSDAVIVCGGLGPTQDDITREVIAELMGAELVLDPEIADRIRDMFGRRGREMPENNLRQAMVPVGASTIPQMPGTAPGLICQVGEKVLYAVPGVPYEMEEMVAGTVIPDLQQRAGVTSVIESRVLRTWGHSESGLAEMLGPRIAELDVLANPTLAFLASGVEGLKVRVTAKASSLQEVAAILDAEEEMLRTLLGDLVFGVDGQTMEAVVLDLLGQQGLTLAVAESVTGGYLAGRLTAVPGASKVFRGGVVAYASDIKHELLDVPPGPVVTEDAAMAMADGVRTRLGADVGLATTGVAGPDPQEGVRVGTVFLGMAIGDRVEAQYVRLPGDRERIRQFSCITILNLLRLTLEGRR